MTEISYRLREYFTRWGRLFFSPASLLIATAVACTVTDHGFLRFAFPAAASILYTRYSSQESHTKDTADDDVYRAPSIIYVGPQVPGTGSTLLHTVAVPTGTMGPRFWGYFSNFKVIG